MADFFDSEYFMPHGHCFLWQPEILWLHVISDALIAFAYFSIPCALIYFIRKRDDFPFKGLAGLFSAVVFFCGTSHLMGIWVLWNPDYAVSGVVKMITATISVITLLVAIKVLPEALQLVGRDQLIKANKKLNKEIEKREAAQQTLEEAYMLIEAEVKERTNELKRVKKKLASSLETSSQMQEQLQEYIASLKDIQSKAEEGTKRSS